MQRAFATRAGRCQLERDIVVGDFGGLRIILRRTALIERSSVGFAVAAAAAAVAFTASGEQRQIVHDDFGFIFLLAGGLVVPGLGAKAAFDIEFRALLHVVANNLGNFPKSNQVVPFGAILPGAIFVFKTLTGGDGKCRDDGAGGSGLDLGIFADVAEKNYFIQHTGHRFWLDQGEEKQ